jgi:hypothetical protein
MIRLKSDKWVHHVRITLQYCASVIIIGLIAAGAMLMIRLVGEQRLQKFLNFMFQFKRKHKSDKLRTERFVPDNHP